MKRPGLLFVALVVWYCAAGSASAQNSSLMREGATLEEASMYYIPILPPRQVDKQDIVIIRVDELSRMQSQGDLDRRKTLALDAILRDWVFLEGFKAIRPARQAQGDQRVNGTLNQLYRAESDMEARESLAFNIAATIVDVRPNGTLVLEAHKQIRINNESWNYSLSGVCRREDVGPDNVVLSRNISGLNIKKMEEGAVAEGYRRGWFTRFLDRFHAF